MNEKFQAWCKKNNHEIKEDVLNDDGTVKEAGTSAQDMAGLFNDYNKEIQEEIAEKLKEELTEANKEAIEAAVKELQDTLREGQIEQLKELNEQLATQGLAIKKLNEVGSGDVSLTTKGSLQEALEENMEALKTISKENTREEIAFKVVGDMTIIGNISGGNVPVEQREPGVNNIARRQIFIRDLVNNGIAVSNVISWVEQTGVEEGKRKFGA